MAHGLTASLVPLCLVMSEPPSLSSLQGSYSPEDMAPAYHPHVNDLSAPRPLALCMTAPCTAWGERARPPLRMGT